MSNLADYWSLPPAERASAVRESTPPEMRAEEVRKRGGNPCIVLYGWGTVGQKCRGCIHLRYRPERSPQVRHWKCDLRALTHGAKTDHKVTWPACARYEQRIEVYNGG